MGGIWFDAQAPHTSPPILWQSRFPLAVQRDLITSTNRQGRFSISDLELLGTISHTVVLANHRQVAERTLWIPSDKKAAVSWATRGSSTSLSALAYLLRYLAHHQRQHRYHSRTHYMPGNLNAMANDASCLWHLSDRDLLSHFNSAYPQIQSWTMQTLSHTDMCSLMGRCPVNAARRRFTTTHHRCQHGLPPLDCLLPLPANTDPIPLLLLFAHQYRLGALAPGGQPVRARTVEDAQRSVG